MNEQEPVIQTSQVLSAALEFYNAGIAAIQVRTDGSKAPVGAWKEFQTRKPTLEETVAWFANAQGLGVVTGEISGGLELLELEGRAVADNMLETIREICYQSGIEDLWERLADTYIESTPSGGIHWLYRISDQPVPGNTKLARRPGENGSVEVLAETRGEGGFVVTAPSGGTIHPSGEAWKKVSGSAGNLATFTMDERDCIHYVIMCLDSMPEVEQVAEQIKAKHDDGNLSPGDDYNQKANWSEILIGWTKVFSANNVTYWRRPGKNEGISATTGRNDGDNLYVFTTSTSFDSEKPYSKFAAYTHLNHGGDFSQSAKHLRKLGYGSISLATDKTISQFSPDLSSYEVPVNMETGEIETDETLIREAQLLAYEVETQKARREAKKFLDEQEHLKTFREPIVTKSLSDELLLPDEQTAWQVFDVIPQGANILLTAAYKSGKTTMVNNLVKSLADGNPFLGKYGIEPHAGRIVVFNYEVDQRQYRQWLREVDIRNQDKVTLVHLRGMRLPLTTRRIEDYVVEMLADLDCHTWVIDPFARAFVGSGEENSNSDVGVFLDTLDVIKERAGVSNLIMPAHTGRAQEQGIDRARGATRLDDWADVRWLLTKDNVGNRYFQANGRDVNVESHVLKYDEISRQLTVDRQITSKDNTKEGIKKQIKAVLALQPGLGKGELEKSISGNSDEIRDVIKSMRMNNEIRIHSAGSKDEHYLNNIEPFKAAGND